LDLGNDRERDLFRGIGSDIEAYGAVHPVEMALS
jgi:hypothetical protein